jgi:hypothetical protein
MGTRPITVTRCNADENRGASLSDEVRRLARARRRSFQLYSLRTMKKHTVEAIPRRAAIAALFLAGLMAGCSTMYPGNADSNPAVLVELISSGKLNPNERVARGIDMPPVSQLCALIRNANMEPTLDLLLARGADVNQPCLPDGKMNPLDQAMAGAVSRGRIPSSYTPDRDVKYRPADVPSYMRYAEKLIAKGAVSAKQGSMTIADVAQNVAGDIKLSDEGTRSTNAVYEERHGKKSSSGGLFSAETLAGMATIAGMAANNYGAANASSRQPVVSLPIADVKPMAPRVASSPAHATTTAGSARSPAQVAARTETARAPSAPSSALSAGAAYNPAATLVPAERPVYQYKEIRKVEGYRWTTKEQAEVDLQRDIDKRRDGHWGSANTVFAGDGRVDIVKVGPFHCMSSSTSGGPEYKCKAEVEVRVTSHSPRNTNIGAGVSR